MFRNFSLIPTVNIYGKIRTADLMVESYKDGESYDLYFEHILRTCFIVVGKGGLLLYDCCGWCMVGEGFIGIECYFQAW
jgi:hypothetical protein